MWVRVLSLHPSPGFGQPCVWGTASPSSFTPSPYL